eukprot:1880909-Rhodomonas_salina.2
MICVVSQVLRPALASYGTVRSVVQMGRQGGIFFLSRGTRDPGTKSCRPLKGQFLPTYILLRKRAHFGRREILFR